MRARAEPVSSRTGSGGSPWRAPLCRLRCLVGELLDGALMVDDPEPPVVAAVHTKCVPLKSSAAPLPSSSPAPSWVKEKSVHP